MNTIILVAVGFVLGLVYSKGKSDPLREAGTDVRRVVRWVWTMGRQCWRSVRKSCTSE